MVKSTVLPIALGAATLVSASENLFARHGDTCGSPTDVATVISNFPPIDSYCATYFPPASTTTVTVPNGYLNGYDPSTVTETITATGPDSTSTVSVPGEGTLTVTTDGPNYVTVTSTTVITTTPIVVAPTPAITSATAQPYQSPQPYQPPAPQPYQPQPYQPIRWPFRGYSKREVEKRYGGVCTSGLVNLSGRTCNRQCGVDHQGHHYVASQSNNFDDCASACAGDNNCATAQFFAGTCYFKNAVGTAYSNGPVDSIVCLVGSEAQGSYVSSICSALETGPVTVTATAPVRTHTVTVTATAPGATSTTTVTLGPGTTVTTGNPPSTIVTLVTSVVTVSEDASVYPTSTTTSEVPVYPTTTTAPAPSVYPATTTSPAPPPAYPTTTAGSPGEYIIIATTQTRGAWPTKYNTKPKASVIAAPPACGNQGLQWAYYQSNPGWGIDGGNSYAPPSDTSEWNPIPFKSRKPEKSGATDELLDIDWKKTDKESKLKLYDGSKFSTAGWMLNHHGYIYAPQTGVYEIKSYAADKIVQIWFGASAYSGWDNSNTALTQQTSAQSPPSYRRSTRYSSSTNSGPAVIKVHLTAGQYYPFRILGANSVGAAQFHAYVILPDGTQLLGPDSSKKNAGYLVQYSCDKVAAPPFPAWESQ